MKVLIINGSPRVQGNTTVAVKEMEKVFEENGIEVDTVQIGNKDVRGCIACGTCSTKGNQADGQPDSSAYQQYTGRTCRVLPEEWYCSGSVFTDRTW